jgi:LPXTG-motif cell wall-anchored protein
MKTTLNVAGVILVLLGTIWFFQGINILPGSFMTGQVRWAVYGGIAFVAGIAILLLARRRRNNRGY